MNIQLLDGKVAVVTGASEGIGKKICELFASEGASVIMIARRPEKLSDAVKQVKAVSGSEKVEGIPGSVTDKELCRKICSDVAERYGSLDILVNNAGIANTLTIDSTDDDEWERIMETNVNALFRWCREAASYMLRRNSGSIINISSCAGMKPISGCAYSTSKGAVNTLTKNMAYRFTGSGIRVNAICPGRVMTPLQSKVKSLNTEKKVSEDMTMHAFGDHYVNRSIPPLNEDCQANTALFLASDLSRDITGVILPVDAGSYMPD